MTDKFFPVNPLLTTDFNDYKGDITENTRRFNNTVFLTVIVDFFYEYPGVCLHTT